MPIITVPGARPTKRPTQCQKPRGWLGRFVLSSMNRRHSKVTDWGLREVAVGASDVILDVGCGGGRTLAKLAASAPAGRLHGIDHSGASVETARKVNRDAIARGHIAIDEGSVQALPFADRTFDLVTAIETHFWWHDIAGGMREVFRVLKPGGRVVIVAEFYNGGKYAKYADRLSRFTSMAVLDVAQHEAMLSGSGFSEIAVREDPARGWISVTGVKPASRS
jgi:ubiquinone/menaquinone biosynthesis C-methylase UbiE